MWGSAPANEASQRGLADAMAALYAAPSLLGDDAIAEKERYRVEDEARRSAQGCLSLGPTV